MKRQLVYLLAVIAVLLGAAMAQASPNNTQYVDMLYAKILLRTPSQSELNYWVNVLVASGDPGEGGQLGSERYQIALYFLNTQEHQRILINQAYQKFLGRQADSGGMTYWLSQSPTWETLLYAFTSSPEYYQHVGSTNTAFVNQLYLDVLGRQADPGGLAYWVGQMNQGVPQSSVANALIGSWEYAIKRVTFWWVYYYGFVPNTDPGYPYYDPNWAVDCTAQDLGGSGIITSRANDNMVQAELVSMEYQFNVVDWLMARDACF